MTIERYGEDVYLVGSVYIARGEQLTGRTSPEERERKMASYDVWGAVTSDGHILFAKPDLEEMFEMADRVRQMLAPA